MSKNCRSLLANRAYNLGFNAVAGLDEVGRGALAGPVVAAACIVLPGVDLTAVNDSKKLSSKQRAYLYGELTSHPDVYYAIGSVCVEQIDRLNILQASLQAMAQAIAQLSITPDYLLVDGLHMPPTNISGEAVPGGDNREQSIMAASIIAKYWRDTIMDELHLSYPEYSFNRNRGYGTKEHIDAIYKYSYTHNHRSSFQPIKGIIEVLNSCRSLMIPFNLDDLFAKTRL